MLLSHAKILKNAYHFSQRKQVAINLKQIRNRWHYRSTPPPPLQWVVTAEILGGIMWWWILWNAYHDYEHITGHYPEVRPIEWSDEELGIPPIDE